MKLLSGEIPLISSIHRKTIVSEPVNVSDGVMDNILGGLWSTVTETVVPAESSFPQPSEIPPTCIEISPLGIPADESLKTSVSPYRLRLCVVRSYLVPSYSTQAESASTPLSSTISITTFIVSQADVPSGSIKTIFGGVQGIAIEKAIVSR